MEGSGKSDLLIGAGGRGPQVSGAVCFRVRMEAPRVRVRTFENWEILGNCCCSS